MAKRKTKSPPIITVAEDGTHRNVSTGIYQHAEPIPRQEWPQEAKDAENARWEALQRAKQAHLAGDQKPRGKGKKLKGDASGTLAQLRQFAAEQIRPYLLQPSDNLGLVTIDIGHGLESFSITSDAPPLVDDALNMLGQITFALSPKIDHETKLIAAICIGQLFERLQIRPVEHLALIGRNRNKRERARKEKEKRLMKEKLKKQVDAVNSELQRQSRAGERINKAAAYKRLTQEQFKDIQPDTLKKNYERYMREFVK